MECKFVAGQKVVCVDDKPRHLPVGELRRGRVYTVQSVYVSCNYDGVGISLVELSPGCSLGYYQDRFRPALPHSTDLNVFRRFLVPKKVDKPCDVEA